MAKKSEPKRVTLWYVWKSYSDDIEVVSVGGVETENQIRLDERSPAFRYRAIVGIDEYDRTRDGAISRFQENAQARLGGVREALRRAEDELRAAMELK